MASGARTSGAESARRVLQTLLLFSEERPEATVEQMARAVGVPISTAYRYVALLRELGLLEEGANGTYHPTPRIYPIAAAADHGHGLIRAAQPAMRQLAQDSGETVLLVRLLGHSAVCVDRVESSQPIRLTYEPGQAIQLQQGASARLLFAGLPPDERRERLDRLEQADPSFAGRRKEFESELERAAEDGWATSSGEIDAGVVAVAAPVKAAGRVLATLSICGPAFRLSENEVEENSRRVIAAAQRVSAALTHPAATRTERA